MLKLLYGVHADDIVSRPPQHTTRPPSWAQSALTLQQTAGNRATGALLRARATVDGTPNGPKVSAGQSAGGAMSPSPIPVVQRQACNFYVYDSTEPTFLGTSWKVGAAMWAAGARGGHAIASSHTIEYMLKRIVDTVANEGCDSVEEIQFWSHGSAGNAMNIAKTGDEITAADFEIPGLEEFGYIPTLTMMAADPRRYEKWKAWFDSLTWRQQLLVELRSYISGTGAEIYYRSCSAFQGKTGQEFARKSAAFWRSEVIGHTKIIGSTQPGRRSLKPGQEPQWSESEGTETEMKKRGKTPKKY